MIPFLARGGAYGSVLAVAALLTACSAGERSGPRVEAEGLAPFLSAGGSYPTQLQANASIGLAVKSYGLHAVYSSFGATSDARKPSSVALFACKPGFYRPSVNVVERRPHFVHCHVDVMDARDRLIGRATMSFHSGTDGWRLAGVREREFDAR